MLHGLLTPEILTFVQLWNSFSEELKTTKQKIVHTNIMEDLFMKKKKLYKTDIFSSTFLQPVNGSKNSILN